MRKNLIETILLGIMLAVAAPARADFETEEPIDFTLRQLGGGEVSISDFRGKWVVVNYWATWCAPCVKEMPELSALHEAHEDIVVLGLAFEDVDDADFNEFLEDVPVSFPILKVDVYEPPEPFGAPKVLPTTIILDHEGRSVKAFLGPVTGEDILEFIEG